ncbi:MAG: DUF3891 family protein [Longimicrobiales bacterium]|nr:DUF3891 family protein [Longimicrobiales bacterium]
MLIQSRQGRWRLIRQHDHGLVSGELAAAWKGSLGSGSWDRVVVLATSLHDLGWRELDQTPRWNPETGRPHDFLDFPAEDKYEAASEGIDRIEELHPYAAVLVSLHYTTFGSPGRPSEFEEHEEDRRVELLDSLGDEAPGPRQIQADLQALRLFDNLSLFLCLTPPGADAASRPSWLTPDLLRLPPWAAGEVPSSGDGAASAGGSRDGRGATLHLAWRDDESVTLDPYPFDGARLEVEIPYRELPREGFPDAEALERAWGEAGESVWTVRITGPGDGDVGA